VWLVGGDRASGFVGEGGVLTGAARPDVVIVQELVVAETEQVVCLERRALSMVWTRGRRELCISGRLPLEQGAAFEQAIWSIAKTQRALDKQAGSILDWQQSDAELARLALGKARTALR
jgi:hypothetical protein